MHSFINHTDYSLAYGSAPLDKVIKWAVKNDVETLSLTDTNSLINVVPFVKLCRKHNIRPVVGLNLNLTVMVNGNSYIRDIYLYANNDSGYDLLNELVSKLPIQTDSAGSRVSMNEDIFYETLNNGTENSVSVLLTNTSPFIEYMQHNVDLACKSLDSLENSKSIDSINFLVKPDQNLKEYNDFIFSNFPDNLIYSNTNRYIGSYSYSIARAKRFDAFKNFTTREITKFLPIADSYSNQVIKLEDIFSKSTNISNDRVNYYSEKIYMNTSSLLERFSDFIKTDIKHLAPTPKKKIDISRLAQEGLNERIKEDHIKDPDIYHRRLYESLEVIKKLGYEDYISSYYQTMNHLKSRNVAYVMRGSFISSIVGWALKMHNIDPVKAQLLESRFLDEERCTEPDIDVDIDSNSLGVLYDYLKEEYGTDNIAYMGKFSTIKKYSISLGFSMEAIECLFDLKGQNNNIDALNKYRVSYNKIMSLIDQHFSGTITDAVESNAKLSSYIESDIYAKTIYDYAKDITGSPTGYSVDSKSLIVSKDKIKAVKNIGQDFGVYQSANKQIHLPAYKQDWISSPFLSNISKCRYEISKLSNQAKSLDKNVYDIFNLINRGKYIGLFQLSSWAQNIISTVKVDSLDDLSSVMSLVRPGARHKVQQFVNNNLNDLNPDLYDILHKTRGCLIYEEQLMMIAINCASWSVSDADILRVAVKKGDYEKVKLLEDAFIEGCEKNSINRGSAQNIWDSEIFPLVGKYLFSKAHCDSYRDLVLECATIARYYPAEYIRNFIDTSPKKIRKEMLDNYISLGYFSFNNPSINTSLLNSFTSFDGDSLTVTQGFEKLNIDHKLSELIVNIRQDRLFDNLLDFCCRVMPKYCNINPVSHKWLTDEGRKLQDDFSKNTIKLIEVGFFDSLHIDHNVDCYKLRCALINSLPEVISVAQNPVKSKEIYYNNAHIDINFELKEKNFFGVGISPRSINRLSKLKQIDINEKSQSRTI
ncbi:PHP domain-containing protein [Photobacterium leiognathi]|uniref:PHP domain-containing protein n=1 Tax=Photobacterium leiognathi TaxID=553611 RepID=UPI00298113D7|nr:PHP domain-containing protein [Photobacterium leiognathi]